MKHLFFVLDFVGGGEKSPKNSCSSVQKILVNQFFFFFMADFFLNDAMLNYESYCNQSVCAVANGEGF